MHQLLLHHPALCFPRGVDESMFFDLYYERGLPRYIAYFDHRQENQYCGEFSPTYFDEEVVPDRIAALNPECRIIISIRDPIDRAVSLYQHHLNKGRVRGAFGEAIVQMPRIVSSGQYSRHIPRWLDKFGRNRLLFVPLLDIKADPGAVLNRVYQFLGVDSIEMPSEGHQRINAAESPRFRPLAKLSAKIVSWMHAKDLYRFVEFGKSIGLKNLVYSGGRTKRPGVTVEEHSKLLELYRPDIEYVEKLLGRELSTWRKPPGEPENPA